jgi:hypothetical protein
MNMIAFRYLQSLMQIGGRGRTARRAKYAVFAL